MMSDRREHARQAAALASVETAALMAEYRGYVTRWHGPGPAEQWETYRRGIARLMWRIRMRIEAEAVEIVPLLPIQPDGAQASPTRENYAAEAWAIRGELFQGIKLPARA